MESTHKRLGVEGTFDGSPVPLVVHVPLLTGGLGVTDQLLKIGTAASPVMMHPPSLR
jgi:hypothetical protein